MGLVVPSVADHPSGLVEVMLDDLSWNDIARLSALFPGVDPYSAATALLLDAIHQAEAINERPF